MKAIQALKAALAATTPDWRVVGPKDSDNHGGEHVEIIDGYGRTATVYGEPNDPETIANATLMVLGQKHMADLLEAVEALRILREAYLNDDPKILDVIQGVLAGDVVCDLMGRLAAGKGAPEDDKRLRYWAVTGRIPGDDEDSLYVFHVATREEALEAFAEAMWEDEPDAETARDAVIREHGQPVFWNSVVVSDSPIHEASRSAR